MKVSDDGVIFFVEELVDVFDDLEFKWFSFGDYYMMVMVFVEIEEKLEVIVVEVCNIVVSEGVNLVNESFVVCIYYFV